LLFEQKDLISSKGEMTSRKVISIHHPAALPVLFAAAVLAAGLLALVGAKPAWAADRSFKPVQPIPVGSNPTTVTSADFNGDGKEDLAAQTFSSNSVSVRLGNGDTGKRVNNAAISYDDATRTLTIDPFGSSATLLAKSTKYKVATGVKNRAGISFDQNPSTSGSQPKSWTFTTGSR
jgi:hypothetical protein